MMDGTVVVSEAGAGRLMQTIRAGRHRLIADGPIGVGDDAGSTPYDLLLAALGTCTSMTLRLYADRRGWPLEHILVRLSHDRRHDQDCADPRATPCAVGHIDRTLELTGPLTAEQLSRLLMIADRCPVHRTLTGQIRVANHLVSPAESAAS